MKKGLTSAKLHARIITAYRAHDTERYRSGHNEAVLKTVCPKGRVGSNPTLSARFFHLAVETNKIAFLENYPSGEGAPLLRE